MRMRKNLGTLVRALIIGGVLFLCTGCTETNPDYQINNNAKKSRKVLFPKTDDKYYNLYKITTREGESLSRYLAQEKSKLSMSDYVKLIGILNSNENNLFLDKEKRHIRMGKDLVLPDLNNDGFVGGREGTYATTMCVYR